MLDGGSYIPRNPKDVMSDFYKYDGKYTNDNPPVKKDVIKITLPFIPGMEDDKNPIKDDFKERLDCIEEIKKYLNEIELNVEYNTIHNIKKVIGDIRDTLMVMEHLDKEIIESLNIKIYDSKEDNKDNKE